MAAKRYENTRTWRTFILLVQVIRQHKSTVIILSKVSTVIVLSKVKKEDSKQGDGDVGCTQAGRAVPWLPG